MDKHYISPQKEYKDRFNKVKHSMEKKNIDVLVVTDPANELYLGFDGWSFYVLPPAGLLEKDRPIW